MSDPPYIDYRFKFALADCARIVPMLAGMRNMLGEPLDADAQPLGDLEQMPAFHGARVGDDVYIGFRSKQTFDPVPGLTEVTADEAAPILGVWA